MSGKKKKSTIILISVLAIFSVLQFFRPTKNISEEMSNKDILKAEDPPRDVSRILVTSCYDCHSNNTKYPWYSEITPVNFYLDDHVKDGKRHLNFSEWAALSSEKKAHKIEEIGEEVERGKMPLDSYVWLHKEANITEKEKQILLDWVKNYEPK
ncbi:heme-binding domain-containing protein [Zunongwangia profunda]|uniref:Cytochrome C n=1 Tax=Zunongwangia profunda TaxID=398743 RepID=A0A3D5J5I6_9FLAO|nr:heme-binding domain-containing protein [Zunongwangia profunda]MAS69376.1 cytochrome C [Zunongwangia sp.]HAJ82345.1 cytochrome C [Zunongwangia profunda]HCV83351.1 cytochrome C [Zunongwangia profunda]|tara:strand:- start:1798 stop:2259 length:462 start_codon:yes stop_codon:yes gene_type:complete